MYQIENMNIIESRIVGTEAILNYELLKNTQISDDKCSQVHMDTCSGGISPFYCVPCPVSEPSLKIHS